ncbi:MAG TPA: intradiol ring-cleavage dioxygenase [Gemmatimonadaceae bacterium]|nr:intradiol ring-cleavage dioxygenase [Gemmatimonadaceae bacterium]
MLFLNAFRSHDDDDHDDHGGLHRDLLETDAAMDRRGMLRVAARLGLTFGAIQLVGCGADASTLAGADTTSGAGTTSGGTSSAACATTIPEETAGPYPGDSSNGPNVLNQTGVVRSDIRSSFAGLSGSVTGVPLNIALTIVSASSCTPLAGYAVYLWHCDNAGNYSLYSSGYTNQNWLRGVQAADSDGIVRFTSIYPGCYSGRWPHIHFEVYQSLSAATAVKNKIATSQIAMPLAANNLVYATSRYAASARNQANITLATDMVFSDGASLELATVTGDVTNGMTAALTVAV